MTKREMYEVIANVFATVDVENRDEVINFTKKEIAALDHKNEMAKKRAAEKKAAGDELRARVEAVIGNEPITVNGILEALGEDGLTPAKITARTRQLVKEGIVTKETVKVDGRKLIGYVKA